MIRENSSSSSDEEEKEVYKLKFWNNWKPSCQLDFKCKFTNDEFLRKGNVCFSSALKSNVSETIRHSKFGNWIPPPDCLFVNNSNGSKKLLVQKAHYNFTHSNDMTSAGAKNKKNKSYITSLVKEENMVFKTIVSENVPLNSDWGRRVQLHDVSNFNDGDLLWGVVNLGIFAFIKLQLNEYNNVCGLAQGVISKTGSSEVTCIMVNDMQLLRKLLNIHKSQWLSICEIVQQTNSTLIFEAWSEHELKTSLERLWFFTCKRRHFLHQQCMLVKLSGGYNCMKTLQIMPKLIVQDIRDLTGQEIS